MLASGEAGHLADDNAAARFYHQVCHFADGDVAGEGRGPVGAAALNGQHQLGEGEFLAGQGRCLRLIVLHHRNALGHGVLGAAALLDADVAYRLAACSDVRQDLVVVGLLAAQAHQNSRIYIGVQGRRGQRQAGAPMMVRHFHAAAVNGNDMGAGFGSDLLGHGIGAVDHAQYKDIVADAYAAVGPLIAHKAPAHTVPPTFFRNSSA